MMVVLAPILAPGDPLTTDTIRSRLPPGPGGLLGTDVLGRDILTRILWGGRRTLGMGALALSLAVGLGLPAGLAAGTLGGWVDTALMRLVDAFLAFPNLLLAMTVMTFLGPGTASVAVAVGLAAALAYARVARSAAMEVRAQPYVAATRAIGSSEWRVLVRHVLPNAAGPLLAFAATQLGWVLLNGAALSFLGFGAAPGTPEWGTMLAQGRGYLRDTPWMSTFPGLALTLTVLAANVVGDGLQETMRHR
jgi:peptide/nickel transport system permease protein